MKILKSQIKQIIKEEYDRMVSEAEGGEEEGYGIYFADRAQPYERRMFKSRAEAEAAMADMRKELPYSSPRFDAGGRFGMEVRPYGGVKPPAGPAPIAASPEEVKSALSDFQKMLGNHDWYYERSDDSRAYNAGRDARARIMDTMEKLKRMGAGAEAESMFNAAAKRAFG